MAWMMLGAAIVAEVTATLALRGSDGLRQWWPSVVVVVGYGLAFVLLAQALKGLGVGVAYATWSGLGTIGAAAGGWLLFGEKLNPVAIFGMAMIVAGVAVMNLGGRLTHG